MFHVDPATKTITMHRGDTGEMTVKARGYDFDSVDRALFTVKDDQGTEIMSRVYSMTNNQFVVEFVNADTDHLTPKTYWWDVRYVMSPTYDPVTGKIDDGDAVTTPGSPFQLRILSTVGLI